MSRSDEELDKLIKFSDGLVSTSHGHSAAECRGVGSRRTEQSWLSTIKVASPGLGHSGCDIRNNRITGYWLDSGTEVTNDRPFALL